MRIGVIIRPGNGVGDGVRVREQVARCRALGHRVRPRLVYEPGDGARLARELVDSGAELVVAAGGDGTVNEVANGLVAAGSDARLAVVPLGTGNDFALGLGIPAGVAAAFDVALGGAARSVDVARVNDRHFVNVSTGGFGAAATEEASPEAKRLLGPWAYLVTGVRKFVDLRPSPARLTPDDGAPWEGALLSFVVANGTRTGGGSLVIPGADPGDGTLDVVVIPALPRVELLGLMPALRAGSYGDDPRLVRFRARNLRVEAEGLSVNADGEPVAGDRFEYTVTGRRLEVMVPGE